MTVDWYFGEGGPMGRLPVYFLVDCSGTMFGDKITAVKRGIDTICETLQKDPRSRSTVYIGFIAFNDKADRRPLIPLPQFSWPDDLLVLGKTALGAGLAELNAALDDELTTGDYRPLVFLLTDGKPTDDWRGEAGRYRARSTHVPLHTIGLAIGADADDEVIEEVADVVLRTGDDLAKGLSEYFDWVSDSVLLAGEHQTQYHSPRDTMRLPPVPKTIILRQDTTESI